MQDRTHNFDLIYVQITYFYIYTNMLILLITKIILVIVFVLTNKQQCAMEKSTVVAHRKGSGIGQNISHMSVCAAD